LTLASVSDLGVAMLPALRTILKPTTMRPVPSAGGWSGRVAVRPDEVKPEPAEAPARVIAGGFAAQPAADLERCTGIVVAVDGRPSQ
jgi:hypothetical protein